MRFDTNAMRIRYGVPIFVTFSPDEAHNLLMIHLSETLSMLACITPSLVLTVCTMVSRRTTIMGVPVEDIINSLPTYDERRLLLARDSLASVDGFKMLVMLTYEYLFGMRVCIFRPDCNAVSNGCPRQDIFGSNAHAEGGIFGRIDAGFTSVEA